jgi:hypothetical protein
MGIEKPHQFGEQRDLFKDTEQQLEEAAAPQPEAVQTFTDLADEFFALTGYKATAYGFTNETDHLTDLKNFNDMLKPLSETGRRDQLIGRAAELESDTPWWQK